MLGFAWLVERLSRPEPQDHNIVGRGYNRALVIDDPPKTLTEATLATRARMDRLWGPE